MKRVLFLAITMLASAVMPTATAQPVAIPLELDRTEGKGSLTVRIIGPDGYVGAVERWNGRPGGWGPGFTVDWGDGTYLPDRRKGITPPEELLKHTFKSPGRYMVRATTWTRDAQDRRRGTWSGEAIVNVQGGPGYAATDVQILSVEGDAYRRPTVKYRVQADRPVKVRVQLLNFRNEVLDEGTEDGPQHGVDLRETSCNPNGDYKRTLKSGIRRFRFNVILEDAQRKPIVVRRSQELVVR